MYSSTIHEDVANLLYESGAHFHIRKTNFTKQKKILHQIFLLIVENKFARPSRDQFLLISLEGTSTEREALDKAYLSGVFGAIK